MANITNTEADVVIPELWDADVLAARFPEAVIQSRFLNKSGIVKGKGDLLHIAIRPKYTAGTVDANGGFTPDAQTITEVQVSVDTWSYVSAAVTDRANEQSLIDLIQDTPKDFGKSLSVQVEQAMANLFPNITTNVVGDSGSAENFNDDMVLGAYFKLAKTDIPKDGLSWILSPEALYLGLFTKDRWTQADALGLPKSVLTSNFRYPILGVPAYESNNLQNSGGVRKCALAHKETFASAVQINNKNEVVRGTANFKLETIIVTQSLYGVKTVRESHACLVNVKAG